MSNPQLNERAREYLDEFGLEARACFGFGTDGDVWETSWKFATAKSVTRKSAIKVFERQRVYQNEKRSYLRLADHDITNIDGLSVPLLIHFDDSRLIVEMSIVSAPYILDFGKVYIDEPPPYTKEQLAEWEAEQMELWGERWPAVQSIRWQLKKIGIHYQDPKPANINFGS